MTDTEYSNIRREYKRLQLLEEGMPAEPLPMMRTWLEEALNSGEADPTAMSLSTVSQDGQPSSRIVLLKDLNADGLVFFTHYESRKGVEINTNPRASLLFFWPLLERQLRVEGMISRISDKDSDTYFASRPEESRISAGASPQSNTVPDRDSLEHLWKEYARKHAGRELERPRNWGGFLLKPSMVEFWQGRENRLHDRLRYRREERSWRLERLAP